MRLMPFREGDIIRSLSNGEIAIILKVSFGYNVLDIMSRRKRRDNFEKYDVYYLCRNETRLGQSAEYILKNFKLLTEHQE